MESDKPSPAHDEASEPIDLPDPDEVLAAEGVPELAESESEEAYYDQQADILHKDLVQNLLGVVSTLAAGLSDDIKARKNLYIAVFILVAVWLVASWVLLVWKGEVLPEAVLLALIGNVTVSILGLLGTVVAYYFTGKGMVRQVMHTYFTKVLDAQNRRKEGGD